MNAMLIFGSFTYGISAAAVVIGVASAAGVHAALYLMRSIATGVIVGGLAWAGITWCVLALGTGDMAELLQLFCVPAAGISGSILGAIAGRIGKSHARKPPATTVNRKSTHC